MNVGIAKNPTFPMKVDKMIFLQKLTSTNRSYWGKRQKAVNGKIMKSCFKILYEADWNIENIKSKYWKFDKIYWIFEKIS